MTHSSRTIEKIRKSSAGCSANPFRHFHLIVHVCNAQLLFLPLFLYFFDFSIPFSTAEVFHAFLEDFSFFPVLV